MTAIVRILIFHNWFKVSVRPSSYQWMYAGGC